MRMYGIFRKTILAGIALVAVRAYAVPVHLTCAEIGNVENLRSVTINEESGMASYGSDDPVYARFTTTQIKWTGTFIGDKKDVADFVLDRVTGILTQSGDNNFGSRYIIRFKCEAAGRKF